MKDKGTPREVIGTSGTSENLVKTSGVPSPRDELEALLSDDPPGVPDWAAASAWSHAWLQDNGREVLALIDANAKGRKDGYTLAQCRRMAAALAPLISPPQPEGDT